MIFCKRLNKKNDFCRKRQIVRRNKIMKKYIINWTIMTLAVLISAYLIPSVQVKGVFVAFVVALVLGIINAFLKPILLILTLPINILTLGLFTLFINAGLILLVGKIVDGFYVSNIWWAMVFSLVLSVVHSGLHLLGSED